MRHRDGPGDDVDLIFKDLEDTIATLTAERDALRRHYESAGPEHNLLALLDLYDKQRRTACQERDALRADMSNCECERFKAERDALQAIVEELREELAQTQLSKLNAHQYVIPGSTARKMVAMEKRIKELEEELVVARNAAANAH
jgi:hypothetical protein